MALSKKIFRRKKESTKVLIVEDDIMLREAFEFLLSSEKYVTTSAADGEVALKMVRDFNPDLILLDLLMPNMDGINFLQRANIKHHNPECQVVVLSNLSDSMKPKDLAEYNVRKVFVKSDLSPSELVRIVKRLTE